MLYIDFNTGEILTLQELNEEYRMYSHEMEYRSFDDYFEDMLSLGRQRIGGLVEVDE